MIMRMSVPPCHRTFYTLPWLMAVVVIGFGPGSSRAGFRCGSPCNSVTFAGCNGLQAAAVTFTQCDSDLVVTLTNTSPEDVLASDDLLTGVSFSLAGSPTLGARSADVATGHETWFGGGGPLVGLSGPWTYGSMPGGLGGLSGISSGGTGSVFAGSSTYGITSAGDKVFTGTSSVTGDYSLVQSSMVFTLSGLPTGFDVVRDESSVLFQYGDPSEGTTVAASKVIPNPEPTSLMLLGVGAVGLVVQRVIPRWRRKEKK